MSGIRMTDNMIIKNYDKELVEKGKRKNKKELCGQFGLDPDKPLITFIGRLVGEKAADLLPDAISQSIYQHHGKREFPGPRIRRTAYRRPARPNETSVQWIL